MSLKFLCIYSVHVMQQLYVVSSGVWHELSVSTTRCIKRPVKLTCLINHCLLGCDTVYDTCLHQAI